MFETCQEIIIKDRQTGETVLISNLGFYVIFGGLANGKNSNIM